MIRTTGKKKNAVERILSQTVEGAHKVINFTTADFKKNIKSGIIQTLPSIKRASSQLGNVLRKIEVKNIFINIMITNFTL